MNSSDEYKYIYMYIYFLFFFKFRSYRCISVRRPSYIRISIIIFASIHAITSFGDVCVNRFYFIFIYSSFFFYVYYDFISLLLFSLSLSELSRLIFVLGDSNLTPCYLDTTNSNPLVHTHTHTYTLRDLP